MIFAEVINKVDKEGYLKKVKAEVSDIIGYG